MPATIQPSMAKGELSPSLRGRVDTAAYNVGLRKARNVIIHPHGGASNRTGLRFLGPVGDHTTSPRLVSFQFDEDDTYVLEFGGTYMRVIRDGGHVLEDAKTITAATKANPVVVTAVSHGYSNGDEVFITGVVGMTEINQRRFIVANKATDTFELTDQNTLADINGLGFTAYSSAGTAAKVFTLTTPYAAADLFQLGFVQSADVMTITNTGYAVYELARIDHDNWTISLVTFEPDQAAPTNIAITVDGADNGVTWNYMVAAIASEDGEESLPGNATASQGTITAVTKADPASVTVSSHPFATGDEILIKSVGGMTELNDRRFFITKTGTNTFTLDDEDSTDHTTYTSGGTTHKFIATTGAAGTTAADNTIAWTAAAGAAKYAVYREENGLFSFIGETADVSFKDAAISEDATSSPVVRRNPFASSTDRPQAAGYFEQRRTFGGSTDNPDTNYLSRTGQYDNYSTSFPLLTADAITAALPALSVNQIRHYVPATDLIVFTAGAEWKVSGGDTGFSTDTIKQRPQSAWGSSFRPPIVAGDTILFVPENKTTIRTFDFDFSRDKYSGISLTLLANHLFETYTIKDWAYSRSPASRIFVVRTDGVLCTMTYDQEQDVIAWTTWDTDGEFESVATDRPNQLDVDDHPYFVIKRTIGGVVYRFIEYAANRRFTDIKDAFFVDSGLSLDSPLTISGATAADPVVITATAHGFSDGELVDIDDIVWTPTFDDVDTETQPQQLNGGRYVVVEAATDTFELLENTRVSMTGATEANPVVVTAPLHGLANGDKIGINGVAGMTELNGNVYKVASKTDDTFELTDESDVNINGTGFTAYTSNGLIYPAVDGSAFDAYVSGGTAREAVLTLSGANHIAGEAVSILANGSVVTGKSVSAGGVITLDTEASRVHVGLKYVADIETLNIEAPQGTIQGKRKSIPHVDLVLDKTRGLLYGPNEANLEELKQRGIGGELMGNPTDMISDTIRANMNSDWNTAGRIFIRQRHPLPMTVLAFVLEVEIGDEEDVDLE